MTYRWKYASDWLQWKYGNQIINLEDGGLRNLFWLGIDEDAIQNEFQSEMTDDGFFDDSEEEE